MKLALVIVCALMHVHSIAFATPVAEALLLESNELLLKANFDPTSKQFADYLRDSSDENLQLLTDAYCIEAHNICSAPQSSLQSRLQEVSQLRERIKQVREKLEQGKLTLDLTLTRNKLGIFYLLLSNLLKTRLDSNLNKIIAENRRLDIDNVAKMALLYRAGSNLPEKYRPYLENLLNGKDVDLYPRKTVDDIRMLLREGTFK
jgi:hypothetical protein